MSDDGADYRQQQEQEEFEQWLAEQKQIFNELINEGLSITPNDGTIQENENGINSK